MEKGTAVDWAGTNGARDYEMQRIKGDFVALDRTNGKMETGKAGSGMQFLAEITAGLSGVCSRFAGPRTHSGLQDPRTLPMGAHCG